MAVLEQTWFETIQREIRNHRATFLFGYSIFALFGYSIFAMALSIGIYWGSLSSGTSPADLVSMTAFP
jgi:hypothetical protein